MESDQIEVNSLMVELLRSLPQLFSITLLVVASLIFLAIDLWNRKSTDNFARNFFALFLIALAFYTAYTCSCTFGSYFFGYWTLDKTALVAGVLSLSSASAIFLLFPSNKSFEKFQLVFYTGALIGTWVLLHSTHLLFFYVGLELLSLCSYALVLGGKSDSTKLEAALKFLIQGSFASAMMLFGFSLMYAFGHELTYTGITKVLLGNISPILAFGLILSFSGVAFKLALWPFHLWAPEVYLSSQAPVVAFLSTTSKIGGAIAAYRWLSAVSHSLPAVIPYLALFGVIALTAGNLGALRKTGFRPMMAFSTIAQSGFLWIAIVQTIEGDTSVLLFYLIAMVLANLIIWSVYAYIEPFFGDVMSKWNFRNEQWTLIGLSLLVALISLTGLPPTVGFTAKLLLFLQTWEWYSLNDSSTWLLVLLIGLLNTAISLYYYIRPFYHGYINPVGPGVSELTLPGYLKWIWVLFSLALVVLFLQPGWIIQLIK